MLDVVWGCKNIFNDAVKHLDLTMVLYRLFNIMKTLLEEGKIKHLGNIWDLQSLLLQFKFVVVIFSSSS